MNKQIVRTALTVFTMAFALATTTVKAQKTESTPALNVQILGKMKDQPVFQVMYSNPANETYNLSIRDAQGYVFYETTIRANDFQKRFLVDIPESEGVELFIILTDRKGNERQVYKINGTVKQTYDLSITKI